MIATPMRCQYTDTSLSRATRRTPKVLSSPWMKSTTARITDGRVGLEPRRAAGDDLEERRDGERAAEADAGGDGDLAEQVEPAGEPRPDGSAVAWRQLGRPVVQTAGGRERRADLAQRQAGEHDQDADEQPAPEHDGRAAVQEAVAVQREAAGEDRDDGEGHREVREADSCSCRAPGRSPWRGGLWCPGLVLHEAETRSDRLAREPPCSPNWPTLARIERHSVPRAENCQGRRANLFTT